MSDTDFKSSLTNKEKRVKLRAALCWHGDRKWRSETECHWILWKFPFNLLHREWVCVVGSDWFDNGDTTNRHGPLTTLPWRVAWGAAPRGVTPLLPSTVWQRCSLPAGTGRSASLSSDLFEMPVCVLAPAPALPVRTSICSRVHFQQVVDAQTGGGGGGRVRLDEFRNNVTWFFVFSLLIMSSTCQLLNWAWSGSFVACIEPNKNKKQNKMEAPPPMNELHSYHSAPTLGLGAKLPQWPSAESRL